MKKTRILYLAELSLFSALVWLMAFTPLGYLHTLGADISFLAVPVAVGAIVLGPAAGAVLGLQFGLTSFLQCFGMSPFGVALLTFSPVSAFLTCIPTRLLMGLCTGLIFRGLRRTSLRENLISVSVSSLSASLLNTLFFMSALVLFYWNSEYLQGISEALGTSNILLFVLAFVGVNGAVEAAACFLLASAVAKALLTVNGRLSRKM